LSNGQLTLALRWLPAPLLLARQVEVGVVVVVDIGKALTLRATGVREGCSVVWVVDSGRVHHSSDPSVWMGKFSDAGVYPAAVTETCPGGGGLHGPGTLSGNGDGVPLERTTNGYVVATWVRRELRELTPLDLGKVPVINGGFKRERDGVGLCGCR